jgi:serine/threonine protein kinase
MPLAAGTKLGPYEILAPLGAGGMGEVYRARDPRLNREVAIKVLPDSLRRDSERLRRFEQEAHAVGALNHPNILAVYDVGTHGEVPYLVTELLDGVSLRDRLQEGARSPRKATDYAVQIAQGLAAAHEKNIVHRDLKPDNVFICSDGRIKILDFGLAKSTELGPQDNTVTAVEPLTGSGVMLGTAGYMSPEQVRGQKQIVVDIFSFGAVLYEMVSGQRAFRRGTAADTASAILKEDPPDLIASGRNIPVTLDRIVHHCLEKNPEERFQSARDLAFNLESMSASSDSGVLAPRHLKSGLLVALCGGCSPGRTCCRRGDGVVVGSRKKPACTHCCFISASQRLRRDRRQPCLLARWKISSIRKRLDRIPSDLDPVASRRSAAANYPRRR